MQEELERVPKNCGVDFGGGGGDEHAGEGGEADGQGGGDGLTEECSLRVARVAGPVYRFTYLDIGGRVEGGDVPLWPRQPLP